MRELMVRGESGAMTMTVVRRQLYPALDAATKAALRASIVRFGVLIPVTVDQHGEIIDGHNRARIAGELGVAFETTVREVADEEEAREVARTLNEDRRMLTREQRLPVVQALREDGHSIRAIAGAVKVDPKTVRNDLADPRGDISPPAATTGLDGKTYPASKPKEPEPKGRRGIRKEKDSPYTASNKKQQDWANGARRRLEIGLSEITGICRGLHDIDLGMAAAAYGPGEIDMWIDRSADLARELLTINARLKEVRQ